MTPRVALARCHECSRTVTITLPDALPASGLPVPLSLLAGWTLVAERWYCPDHPPVIAPQPARKS